MLDLARDRVAVGPVFVRIGGLICSGHLSSEPLFPLRVERVGIGAIQARHVSLDLESEAGLDVDEMAMPMSGEMREG